MQGSRSARYVLFGLILVCGLVSAQALQFEVATVKLIAPDTAFVTGIEIYAGGRIVSSGLSLKSLIGAAFDLPYRQLSGGDSWMETDKLRIEAKPSDDLLPAISNLRHTLFNIEDERLREMLQALLIDRFQLKSHRETKTGDVFLLERGDKALALRPTEVPEERRSFGSIGYVAGKWSLFSTTMPELAKLGSNYYVKVPVLDRTGLTGAFDYRQTQPDLEPNYTDNTDSFLRLIPELGLKLVRTKGPVETFVIDSAAKPSEN
jgi:uncharacterized protein (TIGR03435 family)